MLQSDQANLPHFLIDLNNNNRVVNKPIGTTYVPNYSRE